jgi:flavin reductase (DIM6/NTAB) family NADH-FMN oxidoreductase RutF
MVLDFATLGGTDRYKVMSRSIIPRPIAWITTESDGVVNLAPFSYFAPLSSDPATVIVSIGHKKDGSQKDTLRNILESKKATINFVNESNLKSMDQTSESLEFGVSEAEVYGVEMQKIIEGYPPMVMSSTHALFCDFFQKVELAGKTVPIILEIALAYFDDTVMGENLAIRADTIGRIGREYAKMHGL